MKELLPKKLRGVADPVIDLQVAQTKGKARVAKKVTRKASAYSQKYGRAFKRLAPKYKKKNGSWKKDGFKRCQKAAHRAVK
jgi:ribosomal protein L17